jgi:hypothetical protein
LAEYEPKLPAIMRSLLSGVVDAAFTSFQLTAVQLL